MGIVIAKYLQFHKDKKAEKSLRRYLEFLLREIVDEDTGMVYNTINRDNTDFRLYNFLWFSTLFMEFFRATKEKRYLLLMYRTALQYYKSGGGFFYPNGVDIGAFITELKNNGFKEPADELFGFFKEHVENIIERGFDYPPHEVNYEQTIVAPSVKLICSMYRLTGEERYLNEAEKHMQILERFSGMQPDHHLNEIAIRHWDDFWFGKSKLFGDTFPHYWSILSSECYFDYYCLTGEERYLDKALQGARNCLSLFNEDGSASCAYVYPFSVNGIRGEFYDKFANDQDFALYYMINMFSYISIDMV